jgi:poly-beta-1,6-N-acetyl-D-glucosamine synthase
LQDMKPFKWIIADDGSSDETIQIIKKYASNNQFILPREKNHGISKRKAGGEGVVAEIFESLDIEQYDYIARFDGDILLPPNYFSKILELFHRDRQLGIAGGELYAKKRGRMIPERSPRYHVRGAVKMYRMECFKAIGGLKPYIGWDTIDEVSAWSQGWKSVSLPDLKVIHLRPTGAQYGNYKAYWQRGIAEYMTWSHPLFVFAKGLYMLFSTPNPGLTLAYVGGVFSRYLIGCSRLKDPRFVSTRRKQQISRMRRISDWNI